MSREGKIFDGTIHKECRAVTVTVNKNLLKYDLRSCQTTVVFVNDLEDLVICLLITSFYEDTILTVIFTFKVKATFVNIEMMIEVGSIPPWLPGTTTRTRSRRICNRNYF